MLQRRRKNIRRAWKMERASVHRRKATRPRSNKFSGGDTSKRPRRHARKGVWVGGYTRRDGSRVKGYYRTNSQYLWL